LQSFFLKILPEVSKITTSLKSINFENFLYKSGGRFKTKQEKLNKKIEFFLLYFSAPRL
jgi:hypothetical protein